MAKREASALRACPGAAAYAERRRAKRVLAAEGRSATSVSRPALRDALIELAKRDQALRHAAQAVSADRSALLANGESRALVQKTVLLLANRFPTVSEVGREGVDAAWTLVQHTGSDAPEFQKRMLAQIEAAPTAFQFEQGEPALLADKVLIMQGGLQRYGTQFERRDGRYVALPIEDPGGVEARRASMGLMPLEDYACFLNAFLRR